MAANMNDLLAQKLAELSKAEANVIDFTKLDELYKDLLQNINEDISIEELENFGQQLLNFSQQLQQDAYIQKRRAKEETHDKEQLLHKEFPQLQDKSFKLEQVCREIDANVKKITEQINKIPQSEDLNRKEMKDKFYKDLSEVRTKIEKDEIEGKEFADENLKIRDEIKILITEYEQKEKEFWEQVKQNEEDQKNDTTKFKEQYEKAQEDAQRVTQEKIKKQEIQKSYNDKKMKLSLFKGKQQEFIDTFEKSTSTIQNLKTEFLKLAFRTKEEEERHNQSKKRAEIANHLSLEIVQKNTEVKAKIAAIEKDKEKIKSEIIELQNKKKLQQKLQQTQENPQS